MRPRQPAGRPPAGVAAEQPHAGRLAGWARARHAELRPVWAAAAVLALAVLLHAAWPDAWPAVLLAALAAGIAVAEQPGRFGVTTKAERAYALAVLALAGGWLAAAVALGPLAPVVRGVFVLGVVAACLPWWASRRRQESARIARVLEHWGEIAAVCGLAGSTVQGIDLDPEHGAWTMRLLLRRGQVLDDVRKALPRLESALGVRPRAVELAEDETLARRVLLRVVERDPHGRPLPWPGPADGASITRPVVLGRYQDGTPVQVALAGQRVLVSGVPGSGKSGVENVLIAEAAACPDVVLWGVDLKNGMELRPWRAVFDRLATTIAEAEQLLEAAVRIADARGRHCAAHGLRDWPYSPQAPALLILIDEHQKLTASPRAVAAAVALAAEGRALGVTLVSVTQYPIVDSFGDRRFPQLATVRIALRVGNVTATGVVLGADATGRPAHLIPSSRPGSFYLSAPGAEGPGLARAFLVTDQAVKGIAARYSGTRPRPGRAERQRRRRRHVGGDRARPARAAGPGGCLRVAHGRARPGRAPVGGPCRQQPGRDPRQPARAGRQGLRDGPNRDVRAPAALAADGPGGERPAGLLARPSRAAANPGRRPRCVSGRRPAVVRLARACVGPPRGPSGRPAGRTPDNHRA